MSFGLGIAGVKDWTTVDNVALDSAKFKGGSFFSFFLLPFSPPNLLEILIHAFFELHSTSVKSERCHGLGGTVKPTFALIDPFKTANVSLGDNANCWTREFGLFRKWALFYFT